MSNRVRRRGKRATFKSSTRPIDDLDDALWPSYRDRPTEWRTHAALWNPADPTAEAAARNGLHDSLLAGIDTEGRERAGRVVWLTYDAEHVIDVTTKLGVYSAAIAQAHHDHREWPLMVAMAPVAGESPQEDS